MLQMKNRVSFWTPGIEAVMNPLATYNKLREEKVSLGETNNKQFSFLFFTQLLNRAKTVTDCTATTHACTIHCVKKARAVFPLTYSDGHFELFHEERLIQE